MGNSWSELNMDDSLCVSANLTSVCTSSSIQVAQDRVNTFTEPDTDVVSKKNKAGTEWMEQKEINKDEVTKAMMEHILEEFKHA